MCLCPPCLCSRQSSWWARSRAWSSPVTGRPRLRRRRSCVHTTVTTDLSTPCRGTPSSPKTSSPWGTGRLASGLRTSRSRPSCGPSTSQTHLWQNVDLHYESSVSAVSRHLVSSHFILFCLFLIHLVLSLLHLPFLQSRFLVWSLVLSRPFLSILFYFVRSCLILQARFH